MSDFILPVKSTVDKIAIDLATTMGVDHLDLDDMVNFAEKMEGPNDLLVWEMVNMREVPRDPLWELDFAIGAKTVHDSGNYDIADFINTISQTLFKEASFDVYDYSGTAAPTQKLGNIYITNVNLDPQEFDRQAGVRVITVRGKAMRFV